MVESEAGMATKSRVGAGARVGQRTLLLIAGVAALLIYLSIAWFVLTPEALWSPDEGVKLLQVRNLKWESGRLAYEITYPGRALDPTLRFAIGDLGGQLLRIHDDALYLPRLPLFPLLVLPLMLGFDVWGLYLLPAIGGAAIGVLALGLLAPRDRRPIMWALVAFGSPVFIYATIFWEHTSATGLALLAAWLAVRLGVAPPASANRVRLGWMAAGAIMGLAVYLRLEVILFVLAFLAAYWVTARASRKDLAWGIGALGVVLLPYLPLHRAMFGQALPQNAHYLLYPFTYLARVRWAIVPDLLIGPFSNEAIDTGWLGPLWAIAAVVAVIHSLGAADTPARRNLRLAAMAITAATAAVFLFTGESYRSAHGLLFTTPWAILGLCRLREIWQCGDWRPRLIALTTALGLGGYCLEVTLLRAAGPHGGLEWGARFAMTFYPLLAIIAFWPATSAAPRRRDVPALVVTAALVFLGFAFQVRGLAVIAQDKQINARLNQTLAATAEPYIVSDLWWLPFNAAPLPASKAFFVVSKPERIVDWIELAAVRDVRQFTVVTLDADLPQYLGRDFGPYRAAVVSSQQVEDLRLYTVALER